MATKHHPTPEERDERVSVPLPANVAVEAFLAVDSSTDPVEEPAEAANERSD